MTRLNVPLKNIKEVLKIAKPNLMMTMFTMIRPGKMEELISSIIKDTAVTLAISGGGHIENSIKDFEQAIYLHNPEVYIDLLHKKRSSFVSGTSKE